MNQENKKTVDILRIEFQSYQSDHLVKIESERKLEERLGVGRQRIREVIGQLISEGLLIKYEGKGTYITPIIKNRYVNLICSSSIKSNDPFYNKLLMDLTSYSAKKSINIIPLTPDHLDNGFLYSPALLIGRIEEETLNKIKGMYKTIVSFENYPEHDDFTQIYFDHFKIGMNAAKVLNGYGHKKVLCIAGPDQYASALYRKNGFIRGSRKNGMETIVMNGKMNFPGGYSFGETVGNLVRFHKLTAVFAANDWMAIGLIQALKEQGVRVPEDVSVLGVDNIPLSSQIAPNLSTYSLDSNMMVAEFFSLLDTLTQDSGKENITKKVILQPVLITRDTIKKMETGINKIK